MTTITLVFVLALTGLTTARAHPSAIDDQPAVITAVAPHYPREARSKSGVAIGKVVVEVKINAKGNVVEAKTKSGHPLLRKACELAAQRWQFAEATDPKVVRTVRLTFIYSSREDNIPESQDDEYDLITFTLPYQIEVSKYFISRSTNTTAQR